jgi:hypothetical protein
MRYFALFGAMNPYAESKLVVSMLVLTGKFSDDANDIPKIATKIPEITKLTLIWIGTHVVSKLAFIKGTVAQNW